MKKSQCNYANEMQNHEKFALLSATCCIAQSDGKESCTQMAEETILVQKLQIGKR